MRHTTSEEVSNSRPKRVTARPNYAEVQEDDGAYSQVQEDDELADSTQESRLQPAKKRVRMAKSRKNEASNDEVSLPQQPPLKSSRVNAKGKGSKRVVSADTEVLEQPSEPRRSSRRSSKRTYRDESSDEEQLLSVQSGKKKLYAKAKGKQKVIDDPVEEQEYVDDGEVVDETDSDISSDDDDEGYNPGPDVEDTVLDDEEVKDKVWEPVEYPIPCIDLEADEVISAFSDLTRKTLTLLKEEAEFWSDRIFDMRFDERPMTLPVWRVLTRMNVDERVQLFCANTPREVQEVTVQVHWSKEDWTGLPDDPADFECPGNYGNFATGNLRNPNDMEADAYAGSTGCLRKRKNAHVTVINGYIPDDLPKRFEHSRHYNQACRRGVESNFKVLNAFHDGIDGAWLIIYEGIWQLWLHCMRDVTTYSMWRSIACVELYEYIRSKLNLPEVSWTGMNAAWSLQQGFKHPGASLKSPCKNSVCGEMTLPYTERFFLDPTDPMAGYICRNCYKGRKKSGELPGEAEVARKFKIRNARATSRRLRAQSGPDPECSNCGVKEYELVPTTGRDEYGRWKMIDLRVSSLEKYPGFLFCPPCRQMANKGVAMPMPQSEVEQSRRIQWRHFAEACGWTLTCDHCSETEMAGSTMLDTGELYCKMCYSAHKRGNMPSMGYAQEKRLRRVSDPINKAAVQQLMAQNLIVSCVYASCANTTIDTSKKSNYTYTSIGVMHAACASKWRDQNNLKY
ncbi:hypothetical protein KCU65_g6753, partial [Aureobasidium melanogenum]